MAAVQPAGSQRAWDNANANANANNNANTQGAAPQGGASARYQTTPNDVPSQAHDTKFTSVFSALSFVVLVLIGVFLREPEETGAASVLAAGVDVSTYYVFYAHVCIMIVVGFGFLMTFLRRYGYSAVSFNFMLTAFVFLWNQVAASFWTELKNDMDGTSAFGFHHLSIPVLIEGLFGAGAVLISFGAVLGKTTPSQLLIIGFVEVIFYSLNLWIGLEMEISDAGGSIFIHTFGAYFGLALAVVLSPRGAGNSSHPYNGASYTSDIHSMIGTAFLWIFWPSFNAALQGPGLQQRAIINTALSLAGSVFGAFILSARVSKDKKLDMVHIQNATLAGGVAIGAASNMRIVPVLAVVIGVLAGQLSTLGYHYLTPKLGSKINLDDTCGVHNLHGMPGVLGAIVSAIVLVTASSDDYPVTWTSLVHKDRSGGEQAGFQIVALLVTMGIAIVGGLITGKVAKLLPSPAWPHAAFTDHPMWGVPDDYATSGNAPNGALTPRGAAVQDCADGDIQLV